MSSEISTFSTRVLQWRRRDERLRPHLVILCDDGPLPDYLVSHLSAKFSVVGVIIESNAAQRRQLLRKGRWKAWSWRQYHRYRNFLSGNIRYSAEYFQSLNRRGIDQCPRDVRMVESIDSPEVIGALREWQPDLAVCCGTSKISRRVIDTAGNIINIHGGCLPEYRGSGCIFHALYEGNFDQIGVTLHLIAPNLDAGPIIRIVKPPIYPHDTEHALYCRSKEWGIRELVRLLQEYERGLGIPCLRQGKQGRMYYHHNRTPWQETLFWLRRVFGLLRLPHRPATPDRLYPNSLE